MDLGLYKPKDIELALFPHGGIIDRVKKTTKCLSIVDLTIRKVKPSSNPNEQNDTAHFILF